MKSRTRTGSKVALAAVAAGSLLLTACSSSGGGDKTTGSPTSGTITLVAMATGGSNVTALLALAKPFEQKYPNITVKTQQIPAQSYSSVLTTQLQGGSGPDIFQANFGTGTAPALTPLGKSGKLADLAKESWATDIANKNKALYYDGDHLWGLPSNTLPETWIYNTDLYTKWAIKPATTVSETLTQCATAKSQGDSLLALAGATVDNAGLTAMMLALSDVYAKTPDWNSQRADNKVTFAGSADWKQALTDVQTMYKAGCFQDGAAGGTFDDLTRVLGSQKAAGVATPTSSIVTVRSAGATFGLNSMPSFGQNASDQRIYMNPGFGIAVNTHSINKAPVQTFMKYAASAEGQAIQAEANLVPTQAQIDAGNIPEKYGLSGIQSYLQSADKQVSWPPATWPNQQVYTALGQGMTGILTGQTSVDNVLKQMDTAWSSGS
jgi:raffinose/stachyose/melibiose transport system substrate-binding protein